MNILIRICAIIAVFSAGGTVASETPARASPGEVRALYLSSGNLRNEAKLRAFEAALSETGANGIVVDFKESNVPDDAYHAALVTRFKAQGAYTIARIVTLQDSYFARRRPEVAIKTSSGDLWWSGRRVWNRYWLDPAAPAVADYTIAIAKRAIDAGYDEIQFDYIRFPTDGNMRDIRYPVFDPRTMSKIAVMGSFFRTINRELKAYKPSIVLSIDVFGEVLVYGEERGIGQSFEDAARYFDVISPMAYPSHYNCGSFGVRDPTAHPYKAYYDTQKPAVEFLKAEGLEHVVIRPWIQDFSIPSIYRCGPPVRYTAELVEAQIRAGRDLGIKGFMLWNANNNYTMAVFGRRQ